MTRDLCNMRCYVRAIYGNKIDAMSQRDAFTCKTCRVICLTSKFIFSLILPIIFSSFFHFLKFSFAKSRP